MATMIYAAKEAFYKCQYMLTRAWVGFEEVIVRISGSTFDVTFVDETRNLLGLPGPWRGRFLVVRDIVIAGIAIEQLALKPDVSGA
jgi:4'-phosphopantetheinyl transferase EntD